MIRSHPTSVGRYRFCCLQIRDRRAALKAHEFSQQKISAQLQIKAAFRQRKKTESVSEHDRAVHDAELTLLEIEIEELEHGLREAQDLEADAIRELQVCEDAIEEIVTGSGIPFPELSEAEFQVLMDAEYQQKQARWVAAGIVAPRLGVPVDRIEALLEMPSDERQRILQLSHEIRYSFESDVQQVTRGIEQEAIGGAD
ncbi:hypothetical protein H6F43_04100 [Leptolyngbya sp. FACHB-36]|uniref:hypothetical protein n=1 Tax=Leptolyngbya sp. FACHB-36 TaxID=2692808 RepID=UPI001680A49D|nr:hypothetical protein [Leptolyngbya sp. FACHB-36]MBD2019365.1 hypothetical protein [Leptolyngbya sp. FACHB-36]